MFEKIIINIWIRLKVVAQKFQDASSSGFWYPIQAPGASLQFYLYSETNVKLATKMNSQNKWWSTLVTNRAYHM